MRPIAVRRNRQGMVVLDVTAAAEVLLERLADLHIETPDLVDDLLTQLGAAVRFRDAAAAERDSSRAAVATAQVDGLRQELLAYIAAATDSVVGLVTARLARADAVALAAELTAAAGPHPLGGGR
ncbi:hypothetical protein [Streptomyces lydicus]|uniref:hypothetical protein n=1 Tax=Streptomyces lydicus TaxID=47763 RepID=UPI0010106B50|nr:hypothetical protein [Streptomyces lydicus]